MLYTESYSKNEPILTSGSWEDEESEVQSGHTTCSGTL